MAGIPSAARWAGLSALPDPLCPWRHARGNQHGRRWLPADQQDRRHARDV